MGLPTPAGPSGQCCSGFHMVKEKPGMLTYKSDASKVFWPVPRDNIKCCGGTWACVFGPWDSVDQASSMNIELPGSHMY